MSNEKGRDCIHCGYAMGEREGEPLCSECVAKGIGPDKPGLDDLKPILKGTTIVEQYSGDIDTSKMSDHTNLESPGVPMVEIDGQGNVVSTIPPQPRIPTPYTAGSMPEVKEPRPVIFKQAEYGKNVLGEEKVHKHVMIPEVKPPLSERVERGIPHSCKEYRDKYSHNTWKTYNIHELGMWVHLFLKRAKHRTDKVKARKDVMDAQNYLNMMQSELDAVRKEVS